MASESLTQTDAAKWLRISTTWLRVLSDRGVVPRNSDGSYPWPEVAEAYEEYQESLREESAGGTLEEERRRWTAAKAESQEMQNAVERAELIPKADVLPLVERPLRLVDQKLKAVPGTLGARLAREADMDRGAAMELLEDLVEEIRGELRSIFEEDGADAAAA